jgi:hypothetical protein
MIVGIGIIVLAILDMLNVPLEIPTSCNTVNIGIGAGLVAAPILWSKLA